MYILILIIVIGVIIIITIMIIIMICHWNSPIFIFLLLSLLLCIAPLSSIWYRTAPSHIPLGRRSLENDLEEDPLPDLPPEEESAGCGERVHEPFKIPLLTGNIPSGELTFCHGKIHHF